MYSFATTIWKSVYNSQFKIALVFKIEGNYLPLFLGAIILYYN